LLSHAENIIAIKSVLSQKDAKEGCSGPGTRGNSVPTPHLCFAMSSKVFQNC